MKRITFQTGGPSAHLEITYANPNVLCAGSAGRVEQVARYLDNPEVTEGVPGDGGRKHTTVHGMYKGIPVTAFSTGMSPGSVSITLPEVIEACPDKDMTVLRLGTSGGLHPATKVGDYVVTTEVDRRESTSNWIMGNDYVARASPEAVETLQALAEGMKLPGQDAHVGPSMVVDELYCSNIWLRDQYKGNEARRQAEIPDVLAVSMEFSVICAFRDFYAQDGDKDIKAGNLLVVSDLPLSTEERVDQTDFKAREAAIEKRHIEIGLETLVRLSQQR
jgi:uridine phosphorylase